MYECCKGCKQYMKASDGIITTEICLYTKDKEIKGCLEFTANRLGSAISKAFNSKMLEISRTLGELVNRIGVSE